MVGFRGQPTLFQANAQDNEDDQSEPRIKKWVAQLKDEGIA